MSSAAWALARSVWWPYRRGLAVCAAVWLVLAALGLLMPRGAWGPAAPENAPIAPVATVVVGLFLLAFPFMLYAFSAIPIEAPIDARDTAFPTRTFTLPVATAILVAVPMFQGATAAAAVWVAWAGAVLRPAGMKVDLVWSAVLTAALVAWLQALVWWPFPLRFLRIIVAAPVIAAIAWAPAFTLALERRRSPSQPRWSRSFRRPTASPSSESPGHAAATCRRGPGRHGSPARLLGRCRAATRLSHPRSGRRPGSSGECEAWAFRAWSVPSRSSGCSSS